MRIRFAKLVIFFIVFINFVVLYYTWKLFSSVGNLKTPSDDILRPLTTKTPNRHISKLVTVILRDFDLGENDVSATVESFINVFPNIPVLILCDSLPYPPLQIISSNQTSKNVKLINSGVSLSTTYLTNYPLIHVKTKYILFVPDSTRISSRLSLQVMISELAKFNLVAVPFVSKKSVTCYKVNLNIREWTLNYESIKSSVCDAVFGRHVVMVETEQLRKLPNAFLLPFPESLYLQMATLQVKVKIEKSVTFQDGKPLHRSHHSQWKKQQQDERLKRQLYRLFKIKQVTTEKNKVEWFGCTHETPRCFGAVIDSIPSYLYEGKWTPPCCLANLQKTALHVFTTLDEAGIRYWLEGGSLLGAMRNSNILPWDHDVDVGINKDDISRSSLLRKSKSKIVIDSKGFVWEKATEGNFFRVHFSKINRIHVNLFPFFSKNGTMTKDNWFTSHKNMEFPDHFLHPMSSIEFLGRHVPSPNNIRDFLELKFGKGSVENPQYPDPSKLKFP